MNRVEDTAELFARELVEVGAERMHLLCYYAQAWSMAWDQAPLFRDRIIISSGMPFCARLAARMSRDLVSVGDMGGDPDSLKGVRRNCVRATASFYGARSTRWLRQVFTTEEPAWLPEGTVIRLATMRDFYQSKLDSRSMRFVVH